MPAPFASSREHLYAELARLDLWVQREIWRWRRMAAAQVESGLHAPSGDEFRGLYVSEAEVDAILSGVYPGSSEVARHSAREPTESAFEQAIEQASTEIQERRTASLQQGICLRLEQLCACFDLTPFDRDILLVSLAPELEQRYERLYSYLQDDVTRKRPGVAMMLNLLCPTPEARVDARRHFLPDAPLLHHQLITLLSDPAQPHPALLAHYIKPDPRIVEWLLDERGYLDTLVLSARLGDFCEADGRSEPLAALGLPEDVRSQLTQLISGRGGEAEATRVATTAIAGGQTEATRIATTVTADKQTEAQVATTDRQPLVVLLSGDEGTSKRAAAGAVCAAWGQPLWVMHLGRVRGSPFAQTVRLVVREAWLNGAALYWHGYEALVGKREEEEPERVQQCEVLHRALLTYPVVSFVPALDGDRQPDPILLRAPCLVRINFPRPSYPLRHALWSKLVAGYPVDPGIDLEGVAGRFRLTEGQIYDAVRDACHRAAQRPADQRALTSDDLFAAARDRTSEQLIHLAQKIEPRHGWGDLVLPDDPIAQLHEMCDQMRYRPLVLGEWGFDRKLSLGKGLNALFAGPSGTGKTMAAEVIAHDLGLDLYKIDLSTVVSKYIGETEKNLDRIFRAARNSNAILFFDEADALFGKRSEVRDAHDRYANVEISYLLQKMEEYDGLVILTSNLNKNMDEAFVRRMHFTVEFPYPEDEARRRIWGISFPAEAPLAPDVDLDLLAERYRLTGGNIRNIALTAAFLAARDRAQIGMDHLLRATRREYQKMGRLADEREFDLKYGSS